MAERISEPHIGAPYKTRNQPISDQLLSLLTAVAEELDVYFEVYSGGQDAKGEGRRRTGSTRHDHGDAADLDMYRIVDGKKQHLRWDDGGEGERLWSDAVRLAVAGGATGVGAGKDYMGGGRVHIGYGNEAVWGQRGGKAADWIVDAYDLGKKTPPMNIPTMVASSRDVSPTPAVMSDDMRAVRTAYASEAASLDPQADLTRRMTPAPRSRDSLLSRARGEAFAARDEGQRLAQTSSVSMDNIGAPQRTGQGVREGTMPPGVRLTNREGGQDIAMYSSAGTDMSVTGGQPRVTAGTQSMTDEQRRAMREVPEETTPPRVSVAPTGPQGRGRPAREQAPGAIKTAGGIAGTAQLPRDVVPASVERLPLPGSAAQVAPVPATQSPALAARRSAMSPTPATMSPALAQRRMAPALQAPQPATQSSALQARRTPSAPVPATQSANLSQLRAQYGQSVGVSMTGNIFMRDPSTMTGYRILGRVDQPQPQPQQAAQRPAPALQQPSSSGGGGGEKTWFETVSQGGVYG